MMQPHYAENTENARSLVKNGKEMEMMPQSAFWAPITARRFLDLHDKNGRDDLFSSDLTNNELQERLAHVGDVADRQVLVAFSGKDEYVPERVDTKQLLERLCRAMNHVHPVATPLFLETANHNLSTGNNNDDNNSSDTFVHRVADMLSSINP